MFQDLSNEEKIQLILDSVTAINNADLFEDIEFKNNVISGNKHYINSYYEFIKDILNAEQKALIEPYLENITE